MKPLIIPRAQFLDNEGNPAVGYKVFFYQAGTTTKQDTYTTSACNVANANPVILDSTRGEKPIYLNSTIRYKIVFTTDTDTDPPANPIWTEDNVDGNNSIYDTNGNLVLAFTTTASAVNYVTITNAAAGTRPKIGWTGTDSVTASGLDLTDKNGNEVIKTSGVASAVNEITVTNAITATNPTIAPTGDDTNIGLNIQPKGTGVTTIKGTTDQSARLALAEDTDNGVHTITIAAPAAITSDRTITLSDHDVNFTRVLISAVSGSVTSCLNSTATKITLGTESIDTNSNFASDRFTCTIAGYYRVNVTAYVSAVVDTGTIAAHIYKNGATIATNAYSGSHMSSNGAGPCTAVNQDLILLAVNDYIEMFATQVTGGTANVSGHMTIEKLP